MPESIKDLSVAILAGGLGTRLRPVVSDRPKVIAPVCGRPFLRFILDQLHRSGVTRIVLLAGYAGEQLQEELGTRHAGMQIDYSFEREPLGTAGAVRLALPNFDQRTILLLNGDSFCDVDIRQFHDFHQSHGRKSSMFLTHVKDTSRFGRVELSEDNLITGFAEKSSATGAGWINAGIYLLDRRLIEEMPPYRSLSLEREIFPAWLARKELVGFCGGRRFIDIGIPETYEMASRFFADATLPVLTTDCLDNHG